jgi:hypothetical protein
MHVKLSAWIRKGCCFVFCTTQWTQRHTTLHLKTAQEISVAYQAGPTAGGAKRGDSELRLSEKESRLSKHWVPAVWSARCIRTVTKKGFLQVCFTACVVSLFPVSKREYKKPQLDAWRQKCRTSNNCHYDEYRMLRFNSAWASGVLKAGQSRAPSCWTALRP